MLIKASSSDPAAAVAAATLLCNLLVRAAMAAFLNASCNRPTRLGECMRKRLHPHDLSKHPGTMQAPTRCTDEAIHTTIVEDACW